MPQIKTEFSCPTCVSLTGKHNQIVASDQRLICTADSNHIWTDSQSFLALKPQMVFSAAKPAPAQQFGHVEVKVMVPPRIKDALTARWGDKFNATVAGVLEMVSDGEVLVIPEGDLDKLKSKEFLGLRPGSSAELCGTIYALRQEIQEYKDAAETARKDVAAYENYSPGRVVLDISSILGPLTEKARDENLPLKVYVEQKLRFAVENSWF